MNAKSSVLITGGAGFIGSTLVRQWLKHETGGVVNLDKLTYAGRRASLEDVLDDQRHQLVEGDITDAALVSELLAENRPSAVIHLAAETHVDRSIVAPPEFARTNVLGTCVLLDRVTDYWRSLDGAAKAAFRFVLASTDEVFGSAEPGEKFTADSPLKPNSPYAASKAGAEHLAKSFEHTYGLPLVIVNPTNNYGPRQSPEKLVPKMILAAARGERLPVYGDGLNERDWLHVEDCAAAIRAAAIRGAAGRRYLAGGDNCRANLDVVGAICDLVDERLADGGRRRELITSVADRPGHDRRYAVDSTALRKELAWSPRVAWDRGLADTVDWYLANSQWVAAAEAALEERDAGGEPKSG